MHLILGGSLKGESFAPLAAAIGSNVVSIHLIGEAAPTLAAALGARESQLDETLARAVAHAARWPRPGAVVLLSPACASYDQFENFERRGDAVSGARGEARRLKRSCGPEPRSFFTELAQTRHTTPG